MQGGNDVDSSMLGHTTILVRYQRVANTADVPLEDAPQGGRIKILYHRNKNYIYNFQYGIELIFLPSRIQVYHDSAGMKNLFAAGLLRNFLFSTFLYKL